MSAVFDDQEQGDGNDEAAQSTRSSRIGRKKRQRKPREVSFEDILKDQMEDCLQHLEDLKGGQDHIWHALTSLLEHSQSNLRLLAINAAQIVEPSDGFEASKHQIAESSGGFEAPKHQIVESSDGFEAPKHQIVESSDGFESSKHKVAAPLPLSPTTMSNRAKKKLPDETVNPTLSKSIDMPTLSTTSASASARETPTIKSNLHGQLVESKKKHAEKKAAAPISKEKARQTKREIKCEKTLITKQSMLQAMWHTWKETHAKYAEDVILSSGSELHPEIEDDPDIPVIKKLPAFQGRTKVPFAPGCAIRICWDMVSVVFLMYDALMLPFVAAFNTKDTTFTKALGVTITIFWTLDMFMTMATGYPDGIHLEMDALVILKNYLRTWFLIDLMVVATDYVVLAFETSGSIYIKLVRIPKFARLIRVLRAMRMIKTGKILNHTAVRGIIDYVGTWAHSFATMAQVLKLAFIVVFVNHFLACAWYALGSSTKGKKYSWLEELDVQSLGETDVWWYYFSSFHWAIAQFCPAGVNLHPENLPERVYAVLIILCGLIGFSSFVSSLSAQMTHLRSLNSHDYQQRELLRKYIVKHRMPLELGQQLHVLFNKKMVGDREHHRVIEKDLKIFETFPDKFRVEVHGTVCAPILATVPVFHFINMFDRKALFTMCWRGVSEERLQGGKTLFFEGDVCNNMIVLASGHADYYHNHGRIHRLVSSDYLAEMCLWFEWEHQGRFVATREITFLSVDSKACRTALKKNCSPEMMTSLRLYATSYVEEMAEHFVRSPTSDIYCRTWSIARAAFESHIVMNLKEDVRNQLLDKVRSKFVAAKEPE